MQTETRKQAARMIDRAAQHLSQEINKGRDAKAVADEIRSSLAAVGAGEAVQDAVVSAAARKVRAAPSQVTAGSQALYTIG